MSSESINSPQHARVLHPHDRTQAGGRLAHVARPRVTGDRGLRTEAFVLRRRSSVCDERAVEAVESVFLGLEALEHVEQLRDDEEIVQALGDVEQLDRAASVPGSRE